MPSLALTDLQVLNGNGEPRVLDVRLAEALEFDRPRDIRKLIERNREELERYGPLRHHGAMVEIGSGAQREVTEYWLNEAHAILICMRSDAPRAPDVRAEIIEVFQAWRQGNLISRNAAPSLDAIGTLFEEKLLPVRRDIADVRLEISDVRNNVTFLTKRVDDIVPRRDFSKETKQQWRYVIRVRYDLDCPCCRRAKIELTKFECDHFVGRELNGPEHGWMVCGKCHYRLHADDEFKIRSRKHFEVFQENRRDLFPGQSQSSKGRKGSRTILHKEQGDLF